MNSNWIRKLHLLYCANGFPSVIFRSFSKLENTYLESHTALWWERWFWELTYRQWGIIFFFLQNEVYIMTTRNLLFGNLAEKICNGFQISKVIINIIFILLGGRVELNFSWSHQKYIKSIHLKIHDFRDGMSHEGPCSTLNHTPSKTNAKI